ncbi:MAG: SdpI family protein [Oscillospiraceae bacterium]|nr:SdpI family protein [Oscillospiraceae bacterium]
MTFWIFMLLFTLFIPVLMLIFGSSFIKNAPKEINYVYGYRTARSMKNRDTWEFAHKHIGRLWVVIALIMLPLSVVPMLFVIGKSHDIIGTVNCAVMFLQLIPLIVPIFFTEAALKKAFDEDGNRR